jgi:hypothetical protein
MTKKQIFIISPIGKKDSEKFKKFDAVLKTMIKPAIEEIDKEFKIIRADQISQPGSFIKDILEQIQSSYIVIANLTDLNPNVFYELGVRHALSNRTIMITEDLSSLPSDLKEYRVIEYSAELTAVETFKNDLKQAFSEILENPDKSDNPVQDRLPGIIEKREDSLLTEIELLKTKLQEKQTGKLIKQEKYIEKRINRILNLINADKASTVYNISWTTGEGEKKKSTEVTKPWGNFKYYFVKRKGTEFIDYSLIISIREHIFELDEELSDIRVMLNEYANKAMTFKFIIATNQSMTATKKKAIDFFKKALKLEGLKQELYSLEIWDDAEITRQEKSLGLK